MAYSVWLMAYGALRLRGRGLILLLLAACSLLSSCAAPAGRNLRPGDATLVVKIGLIAPFEGLGRPLGYAMLPAVKSAIAEANAGAALGQYRVALVALNDDLDPRAAAAQAQALVQDVDVAAVLGPFDQATAQAALPILAQAGIPVLAAAPQADLPAGSRSLCPSPALVSSAGRNLFRVDISLQPELNAETAAAQLARDYPTGARGVLVGGPDLFRPWLIQRAGSAAEGVIAAACAPVGMAAPAAGEDASLAHAEALAGFGARVLLRAIEADIAAHGRPTRAGTAAALAQQPIEPGLAWYRVESGKWVAVR